MTVLFFALFGLVVGSFLNVVIIRHREKGLGGRSGCMSCGETLTARDLVPVMSWLALRGRCRHCGSGISIQYPLVEITTATLYALYGYAIITSTSDMFQMVMLLITGLFIVSLMIIISVYDMRHTIIPDRWNYAFFLGALAWAYIYTDYSVGTWIWNVYGALLCATPFALLWVISKGKWMGLGDAKLALGIGALLGISQGITALLLAFWVGASVSVTVLILIPHFLRNIGVRVRCFRLVTMKSEIPFGPYLLFGCILVWYLGLYGAPLLIPGISTV